MKASVKKFVWLMIAVAFVSLSFAIGRWSGSLQRSLKTESEYPWELHQKIGTVNIRCEQLLHNPSTNQFFVQPLENGTVLIVASLDKHTDVVTAFALSTSGRIATDSWSLECK